MGVATGCGFLILLIPTPLVPFYSSIPTFCAQVKSMDDNCGWNYGCGEQEAGVASGSGWNLWVWLLGVVERRYIDFLILLIPTPLVSVPFYSSIPTFVHKKKCFLFLFQYFFVITFYVLNNFLTHYKLINTHTGNYRRPKAAI